MLTPDQAAELTGLIHAFDVSECCSADELRRMGALLPEAAPEQIAEARRAATKRNHWPREAESQGEPRGVTVPATGQSPGEMAHGTSLLSPHRPMANGLTWMALASAGM